MSKNRSVQFNIRQAIRIAIKLLESRVVIPTSVGVPARQVGWMSEFGEQLELPVEGEGEAVCANSGGRYVLSAGKLVRS